MIRSMTGYGQGAAESGAFRVQVEVRSVNHRYFDLRLRGPSELQALERELRGRVAQHVRRGRVELNVTLERAKVRRDASALNRPKVEAILAAAAELERDFGIGGDMTRAVVMAHPGILADDGAPSALDEDEVAVLGRALDAAIEAFDGDRRREGEHLASEIAARLQSMREGTAILKSAAGRVPLAAREKLRKRIDALTAGSEIDPGRLAQEAAILADRSDITEEIVRLESHLARAHDLVTVEDGEPLGKRLDFLVQEIHREINTINSKSADLEISRTALDLKNETEKVREQIQNLE